MIAHMVFSITVAVLLVLSAPADGLAQWRTAERFPAPLLSDAPAGPRGGTVDRASSVARDGRTRTIGLTALGGAVGGLVGISLGLLVVENAAQATGLVWTMVAVGTGTVVGIPTGVHIGNQGRGNYGLAMLGTAAVGVVSFAMADGLPLSWNPYQLALYLTPALQLAAATMIEVASSEPE